MLAEDPRVVILDEISIARPDSDLVALVLTTVDSTAHRGWWPTRLQVETDLGFSTELVVAPYVCIDSITSGPRSNEGWPLNFDWWSCDRVGINNAAPLTTDQFLRAEEALPGRLMWLYPFKTIPGGQYEFRVEVGRAAIEQAIANAKALPFIDGQVYHPRHEPPCVISDIVPPPPCPPWVMLRHEYFTFSNTPGDSIPVSPGGWIRATYIQADGTRRVGVLTIP
jgi:hypothetical protein